ncbi:hypothetical protein Tco_1110078 [Tanacetum coccineum]|uniref:Transposase n=1 Tax=Tanacetum coccineum TaxID=301880 RepID=A0ABQ5IJ88_9ASTR
MNDHLPWELEIARDAELNPFKDVLVFRKMVDFLRVIPINLKGNMWESMDLIEKKINWKRPPKEGDGRKAHLLEDKQILSVGVFDEVSFYTLFRAFWKHGKEKQVTWARFGKKQDNNATLQDFDEALDLQCVETASQSSLTSSMIEGDDVTTICDDVKVADLKKPMDDYAG